MSMIATCLWFEKEAEEAAHFYADAIPGSRVLDIVRAPPDGPLPEGAVLLLRMEIAGAPFLLMNGNPGEAFSAATSVVLTCATQAELDGAWDALLAGGGTPQACGWLKDRHGVAWQVVPECLPRLMTSGTPDQRARTMQALMGMVKIDAAALEAAHASA
ncbi:VOC family protein [Neoroseomonas rubea]|uniref:VOC family protein n=1 Tax=Neoroseomonas rubea TaxID=2748666 RepID=UPI0018E0058A|nr:VOC family protein [Roseomonas rubea]